MSNVGTDNPKAGAALRDGKAPLDLLEGVANEEIARALKTGADKYGRRNYTTIATFVTTYVAAIKRHADAYNDGEDVAPDSGISHLAHIGANVHVMLRCLADDTMVDDRGPAERTVEQEFASSTSNKQHSAQGADLSKQDGLRHDGSADLCPIS